MNIVRSVMISTREDECKRLLTTVSQWPTGYQTGYFEGKHYGVSVERPIHARVTKVYAQLLGGTDIVSFNLYCLSGNEFLLKPCEISSDKVKRFVFEFVPDNSQGEP